MRPRGPWIVAGLLFVVLLAVASRYGFHRDEFYFIEGGRHPDWAQPDNPILVPLLATGWHDLVGGQLILFRILPALAAAGTILIAAATARQLGGTERQQTVTAVVTALSSFPMAVGHLFSITTFDLLLTSAVIMLLIRALRTPERWSSWLWLGVVAGVALEVKVLPALVLACCLAGLLIIGPRRPLARPGPWLAAAVALVLTRNYGEAGALVRARRLDLSTPAGPAGTLPPVHSGHNAFGEWGPPPAGTRTAVVIGDFGDGELDRWFGRCEVVERYASPPGVDNEEDGAPFRLCTAPTGSWAELWPDVRHLG